jgi:hypothetical protein
MQRTESQESRIKAFFPISPLCDLCAMLSPSPHISPHECRAKLFTKQFSTPTPDFPSVTSLASVTSVRCFPLFAWFSHESRRSPPNSFPRTFFLTEAWEKVPQSLVHSQSTILGGHKASLVSHRGLNVLKRIGGTGQETGIIKR